MILDNETVKILASLDERAVLNTYNLMSTVVPEMSKNNDKLFIRSNSKKIEIDYFDECIFNMICEFSYSPLWYVFKVLKMNNFMSNPLDKIRSWVELGLLFIDGQANGDFLRPTNYLYTILNLTKKPYVVIPYNMLSHDISKMDVFFNASVGKMSEINQILFDEVKKENFKDYIIPPIDILNLRKKNENNSVLNLLEGEKISQEDIDGETYCFNVIDEKNIKISKDNEAKITSIENQIKNELRNGERNTFELKNPQGFFVAAVEGEKFILQFPDLIIPLKRDQKTGKPNSIAIEMEITAKGLDHYEKNLLKYKNSIKFGAVAWFCGNNKIKERLHTAFKNIKGTGFTSVYIFEYNIPRRQEIEILQN